MASQGMSPSTQMQEGKQISGTEVRTYICVYTCVCCLYCMLLIIMYVIHVHCSYSHCHSSKVGIGSRVSFLMLWP